MTDQPTLRDRIRRALAEADGFDYDHLEPHDYQRQADAVLAVLPATVALTDAERQFLAFALDLAFDEMASRGDEFTREDHAALDKFRRMADEAEQVEAHPPTTGWIVEYRTGDSAWTHLGTYSREQADAMAVVCELVRQELETRLLRATTTYTVAADEAQR